jgi:hypothetical protein
MNELSNVLGLKNTLKESRPKVETKTTFVVLAHSILRAKV